MTNCYSKIAGDILNDCNDDYGKGVKRTAYYIDEDDIDRTASTYNAETNTLTKLVLVEGAKAIRMNMPSNTPFNGITNEDQNAAIGVVFNKTVPVILLADSPEASKKITAFKTRKGVIIYEQNSKGKSGEQAFIVVGYETGASGQNATVEKYNDDTQGGWSIDLVEEGAKTPQIFFFDTDYQKTKTALESLCAE